MVGLHCTSDMSVAEAILQRGYIENVPLNLSIVISMSISEMYQCICLRKALFSVEAFTKIICDFYSMSSLATAHSYMVSNDPFRCHIIDGISHCLVIHLLCTLPSFAILTSVSNMP